MASYSSGVREAAGTTLMHNARQRHTSHALNCYATPAHPEAEIAVFTFPQFPPLRCQCHCVGLYSAFAWNPNALVPCERKCLFPPSLLHSSHPTLFQTLAHFLFPYLLHVPRCPPCFLSSIRLFLAS